MLEYFGDTAYFVARLNPLDQWHEAAESFPIPPGTRIVTTAWCVTEIANSLSAVANRPRFLRWLDIMSSNPLVDIVPFSQELMNRGTELFRARPDKEWGLTDCVSFIVMLDRGLSIALTTDHHFVQAGFAVPLLQMHR